MKRSTLLCLLLVGVAASFFGCSSSSSGGLDIGSGTGYYSINGIKKDIATGLTYSDSTTRWLAFAAYKVGSTQELNEYIGITISPDLIGATRNIVKTDGIVLEYHVNGINYSTANKEKGEKGELEEAEGWIKNGILTIMQTEKGFNVNFSAILSNGETLICNYSGTPGTLRDDPRGNIGGGEGGGEETISQEDKDNIAALFTTINQKARDYRDGKLYAFPAEYFTIQSKESYTFVQNYFLDFVNTIRTKLGATVDFSSTDNDKRFDLAIFASKYVWNIEGKAWDKSDSESLLLQYTSTDEQTSNDCEMAITAYEDAKCSIDGKDVYLPTKVAAYFKKGDAVIDSIKATGDYNENGLVNTASSTIFAQQLKVSSSLEQKKPTSFSAMLDVADQDGGKSSMKILSDIELKDAISSYTSFDNCELNSMKASLLIGDLSVSGTIDLSGIDASTTLENLNKAMSFEVLYKSVKVGALVVNEDNGKRFMFIVYSDATSANTNISYDDFISNIKAIFKN